MILKRKVLVSLLTLAVAGEAGAIANASAAKVSFAEAWRICKGELDKERVPSVSISNDRYLRGGACMRRYGYHF